MRERRISHRRLACCASLTVAGIWLGGVPQVIAWFAAALLIAEGLIPMPVGGLGDADEHFSRLARGRRHDRWLGRARPLDVLEPDRLFAAARRRDLGVQAIAIDSIVGTVQAGKARDFDRCFRPAATCAWRWKSLWVACRRGAPIPPVSVYRVNGEHWPYDGHHRVSVCRAQGTPTIDAEIVELAARPGCITTFNGGCSIP